MKRVKKSAKKKAPVRHREWKEVFTARMRPSVREIAEKECQVQYGKSLTSALEEIVMNDLNIKEDQIKK
jgi:hypothetical protein